MEEKSAQEGEVKGASEHAHQVSQGKVLASADQPHRLTLTHVTFTKSFFLMGFVSISKEGTI